jgi:hypothetical protein
MAFTQELTAAYIDTFQTELVESIATRRAELMAQRAAVKEELDGHAAVVASVQRLDEAAANAMSELETLAHQEDLALQPLAPPTPVPTPVASVALDRAAA